MRPRRHRSRDISSDPDGDADGALSGSGSAASPGSDTSSETSSEPAPTAADAAGGDAAPHRRELRSYVRREGRFTPSQRRAVADLLPRYGLPDGDGPIDLVNLFGRDAPRTLEIGFGNGAVLASLAGAAPEQDFIGIEVYRPGVGRLLAQAEREGMRNLRVSDADAVTLLRERFADASLDRVLVFFPDPWPKKRQQKRRLIQLPFIALLRSKLKPGGQLCLATDWQNYAEQMLEVMEAAPGMSNLHGAGNYAPRAEFRPITRFELRGQRLGHGVWDLVFEKQF